MRGKQLVAGALSILSATAVLSTAACSHNPYEMGGQVVPANAIVVHVTNQNFLDMDVYAVSSGLATRIGTVTGSSSRDFVVDASMANQDFRIVASPIGGNGRASTGNIAVSAGQTVDFTIGSVLRNSTVFIR
ncbi:MAG TPA: hypothetical protein VN706_22500 [Gemmatimonadaceae bacterium]|jgi:hypothetical protein|nr:hypothetical protein [Gemmatimonadaceae bacterium]